MRFLAFEEENEFSSLVRFNKWYSQKKILLGKGLSGDINSTSDRPLGKWDSHTQMGNSWEETTWKHWNIRPYLVAENSSARSRC